MSYVKHSPDIVRLTMSWPLGETSCCARARVRTPLLPESLCEFTRADVDGCRGCILAGGVPCLVAGALCVLCKGAGASSAASVAYIVCAWSCFLDLALYAPASAVTLLTPRDCASELAGSCAEGTLAQHSSFVPW